MRKQLATTEQVKETAFIDGFERNPRNPPKGQESFYAFWYQKGVDAENAQSAASERTTH